VTSLVGSGGTAGLARNLAEYNDTSWLQGLSGNSVYFDTFPLGDEDGVILTSGCAYPSVISASSAFSGGIFAPHFAEGINTGAENEIECGDSMPLGLVTANTAVIHAVGTNAKDVAAIAKAGASVVWAPRSNISLYGNTMPITEMKYAGVNVALGTDWLPSGSMNELREFACATEMNAKYFNTAFTDQQLIEMATANAAKAMGFGTQIGTLAPGMLADVVIIATSGTKDWSAPLQASSEDVALVLRGGTAMYGDAQLVQAVSGSACSALTVCNVDKAVCLDVPNVTLAQVQTAISGTYPLFSCRGQTPPDEPTCIPYRDTYPNGTSASDPDGDGIDSSMDDCPMVFNPPRPMDNGVQSDLDNDGLGDACDPTPLGT
jgi:large repetitive protein